MDLAQMAGWLAAAAAIIAMLQKSDLRLKQGLIIHTVLYRIHFALLGLPTAVISCVIALARISLSIYTRSLLCAAVLIIISVGSFAFHSRNSSFGSKRRADAVVVSIRRNQVTTRIIGGSRSLADSQHLCPELGRNLP